MNDNKLKSINGIRCRVSFIDEIKGLQEAGIVRYCHTQFRCGYSGLKKDQFFAPFCLEFKNNKKWIVFITNSIRNDRICIQQWNAEHIKRIDSSISKAILVVPSEILDNEKEYKEMERYKSKVNSGEYYSALDDVIIQKDLEEYILKMS